MVTSFFRISYTSPEKEREQRKDILETITKALLYEWRLPKSTLSISPITRHSSLNQIHCVSLFVVEFFSVVIVVCTLESQRIKKENSSASFSKFKWLVNYCFRISSVRCIPLNTTDLFACNRHHSEQVFLHVLYI